MPWLPMPRYVHARTDLREPFFIDDEGNALTRKFFIAKLKLLLTHVGLDQNLYNGHSFRIGAATSAANSNVADHLIQTLGRWSSNCYNRYIHTGSETLRQAQRHMCNY